MGVCLKVLQKIVGDHVRPEKRNGEAVTGSPRGIYRYDCYLVKNKSWRKTKKPEKNAEKRQRSGQRREQRRQLSSSHGSSILPRVARVFAVSKVVFHDVSIIHSFKSQTFIVRFATPEQLRLITFY